MNHTQHVRESVRHCKTVLDENLNKYSGLFKQADNQNEFGHIPEFDVSPDLGPKEASNFQSMIGMMI